MHCFRKLNTYTNFFLFCTYFTILIFILFIFILIIYQNDDYVSMGWSSVLGGRVFLTFNPWLAKICGVLWRTMYVIGCRQRHISACSAWTNQKTDFTQLIHAVHNSPVERSQAPTVDTLVEDVCIQTLHALAELFFTPEPDSFSHRLVILNTPWPHEFDRWV